MDAEGKVGTQGATGDVVPVAPSRSRALVLGQPLSQTLVTSKFWLKVQKMAFCVRVE
jgi:hypothetical protein